MIAPTGLLDDLLTSSVDAIICADVSQTITLFSGGAERMFGYPAAEVLGKKLDLLLPVGAVEAHSAHVAGFARSADKSRRMGERSPVRARRKNGTEFPADVSISKFLSADGLTLTAVLRDISDRRRLEAERALDQQRIRAIYDQSFEFLGLLDPNGNLLEANRAALSFIGMTLDQVAGRPFWETPWWEEDEPSRERLKDAIRRARRGELSRFDAIHTNRDGARREVDFSLTPILGASGDVMWLLPEGRDVTDHIEAERALEAKVAERTAALRTEMKRREETQAALAESQRLEAIGKLTGGVAHDANNMLTVISGNLEMLEDALGAGAPGLKYMREAQAAVERMTQLNRRLLTVARRRKLAPRVLDLNQQVAAMSDMLRRVLGETVTLTTTLHSNIWRVALDAGELDAALLNLAINARDAMPRGGRLHISTKNLEIDEEATRGEADLAPGKYVSISVTDSGDGIPPEVLPRVFEPFFTTKGQGKGTGLGLATVHGFTKQSGGHVAIYSELGRGTTVNIYFPRQDGADAAASDTRQPTKDVAKGSGETVLAVEDDAQVRAITCARLERLGYRVLEAPDGPSALALLEAGEHVDLVFSDIVMSGGMSGFELMTALDTRAPDLPVLLTSGFDLDAVRNGERQFSAKVLQKPYSQHDLAEAVKAALAGNA